MKHAQLGLAAAILGMAALAPGAGAAPWGAGVGMPDPGHQQPILVRDGEEESGINRERSLSSNERWRFRDDYGYRAYPYDSDRVYGLGPSVRFGLGYHAPYRYRYYDYPYGYRHYGYPYRHRWGSPSFGLHINP